MKSFMIMNTMWRSFKVASNTQHVGPTTWAVLAAVSLLLIASAFSVGTYCGRDSGRCFFNDGGDTDACWPVAFWKDYGWDNGCEEVRMDNH